jgi:hypothetical protein
MKNWPAFNNAGDLPEGIHHATLAEVIEIFGRGTPRRAMLGRRLRNIYELAWRTGCVARFILFGSFVTRKPDPNDVDIFLLMDDTFDVSKVVGEPAVLFEHVAAQNYAGASIFWLRRLAALDGEQAAVEHWQLKRDGERRGIIEITGP